MQEFLTNGNLEVLLDKDGVDRAIVVLNPYLKTNITAGDMAEVIKILGTSHIHSNPLELFI
jgi:hypothetical protein